MTQWKEVTSGLEHGGYVAWEAAVDAALGHLGHDHVPLFVKLSPPTGMTLLQAIDQTLALPGLRLSRHEHDLMATERALVAAGGTQEIRLVVFWKRADLGSLPGFWKVLQVGPALSIAEDQASAQGTDLVTLAGDLDRNVPLVAVIDDGIGYLNARFRRSRDETRIRAVWLQSTEREGAAGGVLNGCVLGQAEIDKMLADGGDEVAQYRARNRSLFPMPDGVLTDRHVAHGTHVLDLAAGAAPWAGDELSRLPILAVQLPPASIRETSGRRMETHLVQGLRWILSEVLRQADHSDVPPVIVNISLGSLAGPGDRHAFLADWLAYEVARHARVTGGGEIRLVVAYGNSRLGRLVARGELRQSQAMKLIWRVQPDDHSSSFLELRADQSQVAGLSLRLKPPEGSGLPGLDIPWPVAGKGWRLPGPIAAVTASHEDGGQSHVHLALGPTAGTGPMPAAPSGAWLIEVRTEMIEPVRVTARVQRDDTPPGYPTLGRQSWLDHPLAWDWDPDQRGFLAPRLAQDAPGCPVTREGSFVAFAGADDPRILFVGAGRPVTGRRGELQATAYSSEGVQHFARPGESRGPTLMAQGDGGVLLRGMRATGVPSGSVVRMSGTSVAAPQVTRALARYFLTVPEGARTPEKERQFLTGTPNWTTIDPREGYGTLIATGS
ncbi:MAG: S8 family serine peptidase [Tabrizicola sp.]|nr:S8 family serine peptidase [Tabrizicola sp.]